MSSEAPPDEGYEAATRTAALFARPDRRVVELAGRRAKRVVNGLVTNTLEGLDEGRCRYAFMLDPRGRPVVDLRLLPHPSFAGGAVPGEDEALWLDVPAEGLAPLLAHLEKYVPPVFAEVRPLDMAVLSALGPEAAGVVAAGLSRLGLSAATSPGELEPLRAATLRTAGGGVAAGLLVRREERALDGFDVYVSAGADETPAVAERFFEAAREAGGALGEPAALETLRIERGLPAFGAEITPDRLVQEAGQDARAIDFEKGCYTGQEVVARIHYRGHVNRHLRGLRASDPSALEGGELYLGERPVASLHSRVTSPRFGPIALGYVRREVEPGEHLAVEPGGEPRVEVVELPFT